ncbi:hypothetical protein CEXT_586801 [Caerostris extrusa]|uniref:Uncharacterized protein n=1 Tax=Caerostris extrusa TaxID=172846 RepID=A0AAV4P269_CAEEX|nr:hypothetical protein CEXT_586801 [Caerostris extrusa]
MPMVAPVVLLAHPSTQMTYWFLTSQLNKREIQNKDATKSLNDTELGSVKTLISYGIGTEDGFEKHRMANTNQDRKLAMSSVDS